jgi:uncharacterized integral membrane protein
LAGATRSGSKPTGTGGGTAGRASANGKADTSANGKAAAKPTTATRASRAKTTRTTAAATETTKAKTPRTPRRAAKKTSAASATGATARARLSSARVTRSKKRPTDTRRVDDMPLGEPTATVPADDSVLAASNARRALNPDMPRVAWLRTQLQQMEDRQRERLLKAGQLTLIAIVFITFVLQNAQGVNVHFLLFAVNIRLIWVIFGCALLGGFAGYLIGRPDKSLRSLMPQKEKRPGRTKASRTAGV